MTRREKTPIPLEDLKSHQPEPAPRPEAAPAHQIASEETDRFAIGIASGAARELGGASEYGEGERVAYDRLVRSVAAHVGEYPRARRGTFLGLAVGGWTAIIAGILVTAIGTGAGFVLGLRDDVRDSVRKEQLASEVEELEDERAEVVSKLRSDLQGLTTTLVSVQTELGILGTQIQQLREDLRRRPPRYRRRGRRDRE